MTGRAAGYPPLSVGFIGAIPASKITECITEPAPFLPPGDKVGRVKETRQRELAGFDCADNQTLGWSVRPGCIQDVST
jgi:hypothetical protein